MVLEESARLMRSERQEYVPHNLGICAISRLRCAFLESENCAPISRLRNGFAQSRDSAISVAYTIEPFEFPSYIKVRDVCNKLLQLCRHLQCRACILKPPHQGLLGSSPTRRNSLPLGLGTGAERSQTCGVPPFKASPPLKVLNSLLLVSSDALTPLAHYVKGQRFICVQPIQGYTCSSHNSAKDEFMLALLYIQHLLPHA